MPVFRSCLIWPVACAILLGAPVAQSQEKAQTVRAEVGKPIQAAIELLKGRRAKEALSKAREADAVSGKTPYETYVVNRVLAQSEAAAGEFSAAARTYEALAGSALATDVEKRQFVLAAASEYYRVREYAKSADLCARYLSMGGTDRAARQMYAQALYLGNNFAGAAKALLGDIESDEQAGRVPAEEQLQLLVNAYNQSRDGAGAAKAMEKLVTHYPKKDYWLNVLHGLVTRPGFNDRLAIDVARLKVATGTLRTSAEYLDAAQLSLQDGFPMEATKIIEQGYAANLLGTGPDAERHRRLKDLAAKNLAEDRKLLAQEDSSASKDGKTLFNDGFNHLLYGKADKGLGMMEQGLKLGTGFRRPEHARLQLGYAYHLAGQNAKAVQGFKAVQGAGGAAGIARLWIIRLSRPG